MSNLAAACIDLIYKNSSSFAYDYALGLFVL